MPGAPITDAEQLINNNRSFFTAALTEQAKFYMLYNDVNLVKELREYSQKFQSLLYKHTTLSPNRVPGSKFVSQIPVVYLWQKGQFEPALQHEEIRTFLLNNQNHIILSVWKRNALIQQTHFSRYLNKLNLIKEWFYKYNKIRAGDLTSELHQTLTALLNHFLVAKISYTQFCFSCEEALCKIDFSILASSIPIYNREEILHRTISKLYASIQRPLLDNYELEEKVFARLTHRCANFFQVADRVNAFGFNKELVEQELQKLYKEVRDALNHNTPHVVACSAFLHLWYEYSDNLILFDTGQTELSIFTKQVNEFLQQLTGFSSDKKVELDEDDFMPSKSYSPKLFSPSTLTAHHLRQLEIRKPELPFDKQVELDSQEFDEGYSFRNIL